MHERTLSAQRVFDGRILKVDVLAVELAEGQRSVREVVRHPGATVVLAEMPDGRFVLVRQFRKALERVLLEAVAGTLQPGEDPAACARRELQEETGYTAQTLTPLGRFAPCPGYSQEILHAYHARVGPAPGARSPDEDEKLEVVVLSRDDLDRMVAQGEIEDGKTLAVWMLWEKQGAGSGERGVR